MLALAFAAAAAFLSLVMAGALGGTAIGVAPEWAFSFVEPIVCPEGSRLTYYSIQRSYHRPGESEPHVECVSEAGEATEVTLPAILAVFGVTFTLGFVIVFPILFLPISLTAFFVISRLMNSNPTAEEGFGAESRQGRE